MLMDGPETLHVVSLGGLWRPRSGRGMENELWTNLDPKFAVKCHCARPLTFGCGVRLSVRHPFSCGPWMDRKWLKADDQRSFVSVKWLSSLFHVPPPSCKS